MSLDSVLLHFCVAFVLAVVTMLYLSPLPRDRASFDAWAIPLANHMVAMALVVAAVGDAASSVAAAAAGLAAAVPFMRRLRTFSIAGRFLIATQIATGVVALAWGLHYVWTLDVSATTRALMLAGVPLLLVTLPFGIVALIPLWEVLAREEWRRPRTALAPSRRLHYPKVSLHVPICSEPPDVVTSTLEALAALDYPNFEVLVIDNNTTDEALWRPVERWCDGDSRFRFFHLDRCPGAKAGALNYVRQHMAPDAAVVGLIDSDYQARSTFISALIGYFDNPRVGFVQTPHDYREWAHSVYQRMCYWEYRSFFTICVPTWNERGAAITVGTMSLIRRAALEQAGGWSEWCLTEDSELAPRIHALGYTSVYVQESFGHGLIPERFSGYAKQRRRWTYGPIQELKAHLPMFLPRIAGGRTVLTAGQKLFHLHHDLDPLFTGVSLLLTPIGLAITGSMLLHHERPVLPWAAIAGGVCVGVASTALSWQAQRRAMGCSLLDVLCGGVAKSALAHAIATSALRGLFGLPLSWQRTDKFKARSEGPRRAWTDTRVESVLGLCFIGLGVMGLTLRPGGLLFFLVLGIALQGMGYLTAPALALVAEWDLRRTDESVRTVERDAEAVTL